MNNLLERMLVDLNSLCFFPILIVIAGMERFAFKGVASNLVTYLTDVVKMSNSAAAKTVNNWCGFTSMLPLLVASLADSCDRYSTILTSSFIYVVGLVALTSTAFSWARHPTDKISSSYLFWSLWLISLGQGGYNPSLQAFGADQIANDDELPSTEHDKKSNKKSLFFQWWYFGICGGSLAGVTVMSYIQDTFGWVLGFAIPTVAMVASIFLFWCGGRIYAYKQDDAISEKPSRDIVRSIKEALSRLTSSRITLSNNNPEVVELELQEKPLCQNSGNTKGSKEGPCSGISYLVENGKVVSRLFPIWTMLLMFAVIFQQPATFFTKQGMTMKRSVGSTFKIPPATLQSAITVSIILLMPFYDALLIPFTRDRKGIIRVTQRMGVGMVLSVVAMVILLGISDIFTVVGMQEFFYGEVPVRMRTMGIALYTSVFGVGSFLSALLISLVEYFTASRGEGKSWFSDDMREARLDKYYWLLALLKMFHRKIPRPHYEQTGTPSSSTHPGAAGDVGAAGGTSSTIANYFDRVKFEAKIIQKGGSNKIFLEKFQARAGEKLLKASHCFLSAETGAVAGLLFISTEKIAFCSQRSITFDFPNLQHIQTVDQFEIPLRSIRGRNFGDPHQKIIRIRTGDNYEILFIDFLQMSHRKIPRPYYEQTGTPSSSNHPGAAEDADAAGGPSSTIANYFDRVRSSGFFDTMKFEAKKIKKGGRRNIFLEKFDAKAGEKLLKASHCFLHNESGAVAGLLFISTEKIAFCSQRSITFNFPVLEHNETVEQFEIPLRSIRASNFGDPHQKIIKIRTEDNSEFLFIEFLRYEKARQNFETAMRKLYPAS
uniref:GRAM domain-containing protein n=1 Tax=Salix viminalis TaxID=40686 RepID=A0A6N2LIE4_SALVM